MTRRRCFLPWGRLFTFTIILAGTLAGCAHQRDIGEGNAGVMPYDRCIDRAGDTVGPCTEQEIYGREQETEGNRPQPKVLIPPQRSLPPPPPESRGAINPRTGEYLAPLREGVINPRTGEYYPPAGSGYINPRTGEFIPKRP